MPANKTQRTQFKDEARIALTQYPAFKLSKKQAVEDLKDIRNFLNDEIEMLEALLTPPVRVR